MFKKFLIKILQIHQVYLTEVYLNFRHVEDPETLNEFLIICKNFNTFFIL